MPNGKIGDHPFTDLTIHGRHPFPSDMEEMLRQLLDKLGSQKLRERFSDDDFFDWEEGKKLEAGRVKLRRLLEENSV
ncbi:MAG: hypothetical protein ACREP8_16980 [Candidatus Binatia bacterium]